MTGLVRLSYTGHGLRRELRRFTQNRLGSVNGRSRLGRRRRTSCLSVGGGGGGFGGGGGNFVLEDDGSGGGIGAAMAAVGLSSGSSAEEKKIQSVGSLEVILDVRGMSCGGCSAAVKRVLESDDEVEHAEVNLAAESAVVTLVTEVVGEERATLVANRLCEALTGAGFETTVKQRDADVTEKIQRKKEKRMQQLHECTRQLALAAGLAGICIVGHASHFLPVQSRLLNVLASQRSHAILSLAALLGPGRHIVIDGLRSMVSNSPNMNTLVALGATGSFGVSCAAMALPQLGWSMFFEEPVMLLAFVLLGKTLETRAKIMASSDLSALLDVIPKGAKKLTNGKEGDHGSDEYIGVPASSLVPGDMVIVFPGDKIGVDGTVISGRSSVNEATLNGESLPVTKEEGSVVFAGTINCDGVLRVLVEKSSKDTQLAEIVRMTEAASARTAPVQRMADKVAGKFVYGVMSASVATFAFWKYAGCRVFADALARSCAPSPTALALQLAASVLVVACPCALGLATPTAVLVGTSVGARNGLHIRGGDVLEETAKLNSVVFDKTGTLTSGNPVLLGVLLAKGVSMDDRDLLRLAATIERNSSHPLAKAIAGALPSSELLFQTDDSSFVQFPGLGCEAAINGDTVHIGSRKWLVQQGCTDDMDALHSMRKNPASSLVYLSSNRRLLGAMELVDPLRPEAVDCVRELHRRGIQTFIFSGDSANVVQDIAQRVGIASECAHASMSPGDKAAAMEEMQRNSECVAMVGDGVNDTAALASANVGIVLNSATGAAADVADVILRGNDLRQLVYALELSRATMRKIHENLFCAFGYNCVGIPVAAGAALPLAGLVLTPSVAGLMMGMSSVAVMANSLALRLQMGHFASSGYTNSAM